MAGRGIDFRALGRSPLMDVGGPEDRNILRLILVVVAGLVGGMILAGLATVILALCVIVVVSAGSGSMDDLLALVNGLRTPGFAPNFQQTIVVLLILAFANTALFGGFVWIASLINKKPFKAYLTAAPKFRYGLMFAGLGLFVLFLGPVIAAEVMMSDKAPAMPILNLATTTTERLIYAATAIVALIFAAGVEEVLCRGWLLRQTAAWTRNFWILVAVNGVLFSAMHLPDTDPNAFIGRALMAAGFCYMALRTGGIEFSTGAHAANNILLILFVQTPPISPAPPEPISPLANVSTLAAILGYVVITEIVVRWEPLRRLVRSQVEPLAPEAEAFS